MARPAYEDAMPIARNVKKRLLDSYDRQGYRA